MVLLNVCLLTNRNVITYREVTVSVNKTNAYNGLYGRCPSGFGPPWNWTPGPNPLADIRGGSKSAVTPAEPVMVLNKLYDLSNDRDNLFEQNVE